MEEFLPGDVFIIPLRLDDCEIPERLKHLQVLDWEDGGGLEKLLAAIKIGLAKRDDETKTKSEKKTAKSHEKADEPKAHKGSQVEKLTRRKIIDLIKENGGIIGVVVGIITILGILLQFSDSPSIQAFFASPKFTYTVSTTPTATPNPPTETNTPSLSPTDTPTPTEIIPATLIPTSTASQIPTDILTPSPTPTPAVTLPAIGEADCVPKGTLRQKAYVLEVIDGDTLKVRIDGDIYLVQYLGITVPEKEAYFGIYAVYKNVELVAGQWVTLVNDQNSQDLEGYLPRYVFVDETFVNYEMVRQGFAFAGGLPPADACADFFSHTQNQAQLSPAGMWKPTVTPWPSPAPGEPPCTCWADTRNCDSFRTQSEAQACFEYCQGLGYGDVHKIDDGDNWACESLP
jgi:endonuclease YncB( thermonuclease family)